MKTLVQQVAALSTEVNKINATSPAAVAANFPAAALNQQPVYDPSEYYYEQKRPAPQYYNKPTTPTHQQSTDCNEQPAHAYHGYTPQQCNQHSNNQRPPYNAPRQQLSYDISIDSNGFCSYHRQFGNKARNCRQGCIYYTTACSVTAINLQENYWLEMQLPVPSPTYLQHHGSSISLTTTRAINS